MINKKNATFKKFAARCDNDEKSITYNIGNGCTINGLQREIENRKEKSEMDYYSSF